MNIYEKMQLIKEEFLNKKIRKSGKNKFANYTYYELADITPVILELNNKYKLFTQTTFDKEMATLKIINIEAPQEVLIYTSPMEELELKGCNKIQALGGVETYQRRYLLMSAYDIIENEMFDSKTYMSPEERLKSLAKLKTLVEETDTDYEELLEHYEVKTNTDLTNNQLQDALKILEKKIKKVENK